MKTKRIVVRIEMPMLSGSDGKFSHQKMDRLAMVLANLNNSGKQVLVVSSGAIALGRDKLGLSLQSENAADLQALAAIGQTELMRLYQYHFEQYNQMVAQVLLTNDLVENNESVKNSQNTFNTLLNMRIVPIINENDTVSTTDIELNDNYPLTLNVAQIVEADIILIKSDNNGKYIIQPKGFKNARMVSGENELFEEIESICKRMDQEPQMNLSFPQSIKEIVVNN